MGVRDLKNARQTALRQPWPAYNSVMDCFGPSLDRAPSDRERKFSPKVFLTEVLGNPLGSWTSAPSGHGCRRWNACFFPAFWPPWPKFGAGISARMTPGCPREVRPKNFLSGLIFRSWNSGRVRPRQGTEICNFGAPSPLEALHWIFCFFSCIYVQFSKTRPLKSGGSSENPVEKIASNPVTSVAVMVLSRRSFKGQHH